MSKLLPMSLVALILAVHVDGAGPDVQRQLKDANGSFTFDGAPINPLALKELTTWESDSYPGPIAVDLDGTSHSNRYFGEYAKTPQGSVRIDMRTTKVVPSAENEGWFSYERIGTLTNGIHVVETSDNGGGTGVFKSLLLIRFAVDFEYTDTGARRDRVVMKRLGEVTLGDRYGGTVTVKGNAVEIAADRKSGREKQVLRFQ